MSRRRRWITLILSACAICAAAIWYFKPIGSDFDRAVWHDQSKVQSGARQKMADRLVARGTLLGKTRQEVIAMLGPPEERSNDVWICYGLGPERGLISMDGEILIVELGPDGKVAACRIITT